MRCPSCGFESPDAFKFCGGCGAALGRVCAGCGFESPPGFRFCGECGRALDAQPAASGTGPESSAPRAGPALPSAFAAGRYQIERLLGEGSRKLVYLARDTRLGREVALAAIKTQGLDQTALARVRREAEAMGRLGDHPNIVTIHDVADEKGQPYIVSQYMSGGDLEARIAAAEAHRLPVDEVLRVGAEICRALEHAHARGVIHRDIKPGNVWLGDDGSAKLGDFGLAIQADRSRLTSDGMMVGTAAYMAPEQALGRAPDERSDLYGLGALLYETLTGRPPFVGDDAVSVISQHINTPPVAPSWHNRAVSRPLEALVLALLAKDPEQRSASAAQVRAALEEIEATAAQPAQERELDEPNPLDRLSGGDFVGRSREIGEARRWIDEGLSGRGRVLMLVGEPGIGKTRTAEELCTYARLRGAQVLWGRCYEGAGAPAYWPWVQIVRAYVHERDPEALRSEMGPGAADIAEVVSDVRERLPDLPTPPALEPEQMRFRLFDSVTQFLKNASRSEPLVLVLDDLHWADDASLLLLQFLTREMAESRIAVVGTYRDVELSRTHPLEQTLAELARGALHRRILLRGLAREEVRLFLERAAAIDPPEALVESVFRETEGNPFFIHEVVRLLQADGRLEHPERVESWSVEIPQGIRQAVGRRLDGLPEACNAALAVASVIGRDFDVAVLERVSETPRAELLEQLGRAVAARVLLEPEGPPGSYRFSHALIRETLYDELSTARRIRLHHRIGETLEALHADRPGPALSQLAYHFCEGAPAGDPEKAIACAVRAAERATELVAYEEAAATYERALQVLELADPVDPIRQCELLVACAEAHKAAGAMDRAQAAARRAAEIARREHRADLLAGAALAFSWNNPETEETEGQHLLEEALEHLGDGELGEGESALRARLLTHLAGNLGVRPAERRRGESLIQEAVALARETGDPSMLGNALSVAAWPLWRDGHPHQLLVWAEELGALAERTGGRELALSSRVTRAHGLLELGRVPEAWAELDAFRALAEEHRQPMFLWWAEMQRALRATMEGRLDAAEAHARSARSLGRQAARQNAEITFWVEMLEIQLLRGGAEATKQLASEPPEQLGEVGLVSVRAWEAWFRAALGDAEGARRELDALAEDGFAAASREINSLCTLGWLADTCAMLRDEERAALLYDQLLPHARRLMCQYSYACEGPTSRPLGALAHLLGRLDEAEQHFEEALESCERASARPLATRTRIEYARMLRDRAGPGDAARALELVNRALDAAQEIGMAAALREALALKLELQGLGPGEPQGSIHVVSSTVQERRPDLAPHAAPDGTVTLMFSDMEGFTEMTERLGDLRAREVIREHNAIVRQQLRAHGGYEVELQGDGFLLAFGSARQALRCAIAIQRAFTARNRDADAPIRVRIGLHTGEALKDAEKFFGRTVILAARIASQARGGEILVSSLLRELTRSLGELRFGAEREARLKGIAEPQRLAPVEWD